MMQIQNGKLFADTKTLTASFERGFLTSLRSKRAGEEFIASPLQGSALQR